MKNLFIFFLTCMCICMSMQAQLRVDSNLQSNMVLQQNATFTVAGEATPSEQIRVTTSWDGGVFHDVKASGNGRWSVVLNIPSATVTPQSISVQENTTLVFDNILIGEVWLCSGQSNMQWSLINSQNGVEEVNNSSHSNIRLLTMTPATSTTKQETFTETWKLCTPNNTSLFSGVGYFFGCELQQRLGDVPIGLIMSCEGATSIEFWMDKDSIDNNPELKEATIAHQTSKGNGYDMASLYYNKMIFPLKNIPIGGVLWYQGEGNQGMPYIYGKYLQTLVNNWRNLWNSQFPFYIAQVAPYANQGTYSSNYANPALRFVQAQASESIVLSGIEINDDIVDNVANIHPTNKQDIGLRLAYLALSEKYEKSQYDDFRCPIYDSFSVNGNKLTVQFKYAGLGLKTTDGKAPTLFEVCGADHVFYPANAAINGSSVELTSPGIAVPIAARMGWSYTKVTNLRNQNNLPVSVFRTYNWDDITEEKTVVFLKTGGTGNGFSPESPTSSINTAYSILEQTKTEGIVVVVGKFTIPSTGFTRTQNYATKRNKVTMTSVWDGVDYREGNSDCGIAVGTAGFRFVLNRPHIFENIRFIGSTTITQPFILIVSNYNSITMGDGIEVIDFPSTEIVKSVSILGGCQNGQVDGTGITPATDLDANITIKSGKFIVIGFNRDINSTCTGTANINIQGGEITGFYGGSLNLGHGGNLNLSVSGGTFKSKEIYVGNRPYNKVNNVAGNSTIAITGGDFTACPAIFGEMTGVSKIDLSALNTADFNFIKRISYGFDEIKSKDGWSIFYNPDKVFASGTFTSSTSTTLPYRIYLPENYVAGKAYPLVLWMHGNGSRGVDNKMQIEAEGSSFVSTILNSGNQCIILAPQCPTTSQWVADGYYPGSENYDVKAPMSIYLAAAKELFDNVIDTAAVDAKRIYVCGASNGAGATWDLMCRFPDLFAAGVPIAGCPDATNAAAIADILKTTPIWTFHGDADATLSVEGTRGLVAAIQTVGGTKIQYTEYAGLGHDIWWNSAATEGLSEWLFTQEKNFSSRISETVLSQIHISVNEKMLHVVADSLTNISIYTHSGTKLFQAAVQGEKSFPLEKGVYIIATNQGISKIII